MAKFNSRGDVLAGIGGLQGSLNGVFHPFSTDGGGLWLDDNTVLVQLRPSSVLVKWIPGQPYEVIQPSRGANGAEAGGGNYLAWLAGTGMYGSLGLKQAAAPIAVGRDGIMAYCPVRDTGIGIIITDANGQQIAAYPNEIATAGQILPNGQMIWYDVVSHQHHAHGRNPVRPALSNAMGVKLVTLNGEDWLLYWSEGIGLVLQPDGASEGWVLDTRPNEFNADVVVVDNEIRVCWGIHAGEFPNEIAICGATRQGVRYLREAENWTTQLGEWRSFVMPPTMNPLPRKMWIAPFFSLSDRYGDNPNPQGNALLVVEDSVMPRALGKGLPVIGAGGFASIVMTLADVPNALASTHGPVITYEDHYLAEAWPSLLPKWPKRVWPAVQAYRRPNESLSDFEIRVTAMLNRVASYGRPMVLVPRFDDFNGDSTIEAQLEAMRIYEKWIRVYNIIGMLPFSDRRGNGISNNPSLQVWLTAFTNATTPPAIQEYWTLEEDMEAPKVSILRYDRDILPGRMWSAEIQDPNNGTLITIEFKPMNTSSYSFHVKIENEEGSDRSGLTRQVIVR